MPDAVTESVATATRPIDQVRRAWAADRRSISVPEWGGLVIYFGRLNTADMNAADEQKPDSPWERNLLLLIQKAQDEQGRPLFTTGDLHYLRTEADFWVIQRVVNFLFETTITLDQARKAVAGDPPSASG